MGFHDAKEGMMGQLAMDGNDYELPDDLFGEEDHPTGKEIADFTLVSDDDDDDSDSEATILLMTGLIQVFGVEFFGCGTDEASPEDDDDDINKSYDDIHSLLNSIIRLDREIDEAIDYEAGLLYGDMEGWDVFGDQEFVEGNNNAPGGSEPGDALFFALGYVGVERLDVFGSEKYMEGVEGYSAVGGSQPPDALLDVFGSEKYMEAVEDNNAAGGSELPDALLDVLGSEEGVEDNKVAVGSEPPDALLFALGYLGVEDLLSVERVCKSLQDAVRNDPLLWRNLYIRWNHEITDDDLIRLSNRAQGSMRTLSIVECMKVTNHGVKHVLENNLGLTKLSVSSCCGMRVGKLLQDLKAFQSVSMPGIKCLRIGGVPDATKENFNELKLLLGSDVNKEPKKYIPRYHCPDQLNLSLDVDRDIDLEICPRCQEVREVFDCPAESCKSKAPPLQKCRSCTLCTERCIQCGRCLDDVRYLENFSRKCCCFDCISSNGHGKFAIYGIICRL